MAIPIVSLAIAIAFHLIATADATIRIIASNELDILSRDELAAHELRELIQIQIVEVAIVKVARIHIGKVVRAATTTTAIRHAHRIFIAIVLHVILVIARRPVHSFQF